MTTWFILAFIGGYVAGFIAGCVVIVWAVSGLIDSGDLVRRQLPNDDDEEFDFEPIAKGRK